MGVGATMDYTGAVIVSGNEIPIDYFDGDSENAIWTGSVDNSESFLFEDYDYLYKTNGFAFNGDYVPLIDVNKVQGLDMPVMNANIDDTDGQHGGTAHIKFSQPRTIIVDGTLYADTLNIEPVIDELIGNYMPDDTNYPFYFKHPGVDLRYIMCKSLAMKADVDELRRLGSTTIQAQLVAEDPRKYVNNADQTMVAGTNYTPSNPGNVNTYAIFTINGAFTSVTFTNSTQSKSVTLVTTRVAGDVTVVDMRQRSVTINGIENSNVVTVGNWWDIPKGGGQTVKYTVTGGPPTSVIMSTKQGWM
jgi:phage-related protein